jgi:hypothetical protein
MTFNSFAFNTTSFNSVSHLKKISKITYEKAKGTPSEDVARLVNENIQGWNVSDQKQMDTSLDSLIFILKMLVPNVPENEPLISKIDEIKNYIKVEELVAKVTIILPLIQTASIIGSIKDKMDDLISSIEGMKISQEPGIKEEIQVTVGLSGFGSGLQRVITIPIKEISYSELQEDLQKCSGKMMDVTMLPSRLKDRIKKYFKKNEGQLLENH